MKHAVREEEIPSNVARSVHTGTDAALSWTVS